MYDSCSRPGIFLVVCSSCRCACLTNPYSCALAARGVQAVRQLSFWIHPGCRGKIVGATDRCSTQLFSFLAKYPTLLIQSKGWDTRDSRGIKKPQTATRRESCCCFRKIVSICISSSLLMAKEDHLQPGINQQHNHLISSSTSS